MADTKITAHYSHHSYLGMGLVMSVSLLVQHIVPARTGLIFAVTWRGQARYGQDPESLPGRRGLFQLAKHGEELGVISVVRGFP